MYTAGKEYQTNLSNIFLSTFNDFLNISYWTLCVVFTLKESEKSSSNIKIEKYTGEHLHLYTSGLWINIPWSISRGTEQEGVTWGHFYSALLLFGKGHFCSQELSMEVLDHRGRKMIFFFKVNEEVDGQWLVKIRYNYYTVPSCESYRYSAKQKRRSEQSYVSKDNVKHIYSQLLLI